MMKLPANEVPAAHGEEDPYMSISAYFGPPGCGKTSVLTLIAQKELKRISKGKSKYKYVYTNFPCKGCLSISFMDFGYYYYHDCLILLDELTLSADSRDWKNLPDKAKQFITLHRHFKIDLIYNVQDWSRCEKTMRTNTTSLFYLSPFLSWTIARPIYRTININEYMSEIVMGYRFPHLSELISGGTKFYPIKKARKYFNSFDTYGFDLLPDPKSSSWS